MYGRIECPNPICPQPDTVQSVSAIVHTGTSLVYAPGQYVTSQDALSKILFPPAPPTRRQYAFIGRLWGWTRSINWKVALVIGVVMLAVICQLLETFLYSLIDAFGFDVGRITFLVCLAAIGGLFIFGYFVYPEIIYRRKYPKWASELATWEELFYCYGCGSVFNPTEGGRFVPASRMKELLV